MNFLDAFEPTGNPHTVRGTPAADPAAALRRSRAFRTPVTPLLGAPVPDALLDRGVVVQGGQGFGKTLTLLKAFVAPEIARMAEPGSKRKLILTDVKGDLTAAALALAKVQPRPPRVVLLNPFDRFAHALDPHELSGEPTRITRLVAALTYRRRDARSDDFFDGAARSHLVDLVKVLHTRVPGRWTWRDFYLIATTYGLFERVLANSRAGRGKAEAVVKKTFAGIVSTVQAWLDPYEAAFACMVRSPKLSIEEFLRGSGVLLLTAPEDQIESLSPLVRTVLRHTKDRLLTDNGGDPDSHTTIVLDEFAYLESCVETIEPLFGRARSARVTTCCAWQSWPAVCAAHTEPRMKGILDNAAVRVWLGCGADSAEVAGRDCMSCEVDRLEWSVTSSPSGASWTHSARRETRANVIASQVQGLAPPTPGDLTVRGFVCAAHLGGPLYCEEDFAPFAALLNALPRVPAVRPRPAAEHWLAPWDDVLDGNRLEPLFVRER